MMARRLSPSITPILSCAGGNAAQRLQSQTAPIVMKLTDREQQLMAFEQRESRLLHMWAKELGLLEKTLLVRTRKSKGKDAAASSEEQLVYSLTVHGPS